MTHQKITLLWNTTLTPTQSCACCSITHLRALLARCPDLTFHAVAQDWAAVDESRTRFDAAEFGGRIHVHHASALAFVHALGREAA